MNAWPALVYASGITAAQNRQCIGLASAHQVAAGSRNVGLYPDQTLAQLKADKSFTFSDAELKAVVNNVYFGGVSVIAPPMGVYKAVYDSCVRGGPDPRWKPLQ
ncbi:hypothetical protein [Achromobacter spanius]|nr:hypothetical protein [Achromobacter spanius]